MRDIFLFFILGCLACGCSYINKKFSLKDDHFLEELVEDKIHSDLGIDVDLTPFSPE